MKRNLFFFYKSRKIFFHAEYIFCVCVAAMLSLRSFHIQFSTMNFLHEKSWRQNNFVYKFFSIQATLCIVSAVGKTAVKSEKKN